mmetsp:Transcript_15714/g.20142  ORF Transcript_15714/g.20142 Transcript_15714/m.20142 type:complete len:137 (-) Transcript_15714:300-710(-)
MSNVTEVKSYDEALGALKKGAQNVRVRTKYTGNEQSFQKFVDALAGNKTCKILDLWGNGIGDSGAIAIGKSLETNESLTNLNLRNNNIQDTGAGAIHDAIRGNKKSALVTLTLDENHIDRTLLDDIAAVLERNTSL